MADQVRAPVSVAGLISSALAAAALVWYLAILASEAGSEDLGRVSLVAGTIGAAAIAAGVASLAGSGRLRTLTLSAAAGILMAMGYLALFSIGAVLVLAGVAAAGAAAAEVRRHGSIGLALMSSLAGAGVVLAPFALSG